MLFFSSLWAAIFLGEQLHANEIVGFFIILVGLLLVTGLWTGGIDPGTTDQKPTSA